MSTTYWILVKVLILLINLQLGRCVSGFRADLIARQELDKVSVLPGQEFNISFSHYSGYVNVNEESGRALFYWFFEAEEDPDDKPLLLWLNGGPGCSSIAYGEAEEIGPFHIEADGLTLYLNPYSWNKGSTVFKLDVCVSSAFPLCKVIWVRDIICTRFYLATNYKEAFTSQTYNKVLSHLYRSDLPEYGRREQFKVTDLPMFCSSILQSEWAFLTQTLHRIYSLMETKGQVLPSNEMFFIFKPPFEWFERFPQYKGREFYLSGESYAGHYVPQLSETIVDYNNAAGEKIINIKGFMVGNALTDDHHDHLGLFQFMWSAGLISDETFKLLNDLCDFQSFIHTSNSCDNILDIASQELGNIDPYSIFTPPCPASVSQSNRLLKRMKVIGHVNEKYDPCTEKHSVVYFNHPEVQKALHVNKEIAPAKWDTCNDAVNSNWKDSPITVLDVYRKLIHEGLRIWVFSGDTDAVLPVTSTRYSIDTLGLPTVKPWRAWYDEGQVGGWTQEYEGLTFVSVRGAGHEVPLHKPKLALTLIKSYLAGNSMPKQLELISDA